VRWFLLALCLLQISCAVPDSPGFPSRENECPVRDEAVAREIADTVIAANAREGHTAQLGYRVTIEDAGRFWTVTDGPSGPVVRDDQIMFSVGGTSISFRIDKCTGRVSRFGTVSWR
jgi:hypothetical protein